MNILFFLTPKEEVAHVEEDDTLRQVVEKLEYHGYSAIPLLALDGKYIGTITEGDLLWETCAYFRGCAAASATGWTSSAPSRALRRSRTRTLFL